jgi:actin cytoskeleton-regulatory complex protein PAN1
MLDILSHKEITVLFANIEDILLTNTVSLGTLSPRCPNSLQAFLSSLEERQKECRLYVDKIGDILVSHFPNMGVYMEYCVNQQTANTVLQTLIQSKPVLVEQMNVSRRETQLALTGANFLYRNSKRTLQRET